MDLYFKALIFTSATNFFAIWRLFFYRVQRSLVFLSIFLIFQFAQAITLIIGTRTPASPLYERVYETTEPLNWVFYILIVREMYNLVFAAYPGIATLARWSTYASAGASAVLCVFMAFYSSRTLDHPQAFGYIVFWERCVAFFLGAFILLMVFFLARYPIKLEFNTASSVAVFTVYFTGVFLLIAIGSLQTETALWLRTYGLFALSSACYLVWGLLLRPSANPAVRLRAHIDVYEEKRLLDQLALINNMLVKSGRH